MANDGAGVSWLGVFGLGFARLSHGSGSGDTFLALKFSVGESEGGSFIEMLTNSVCGLADDDLPYL